MQRISFIFIISIAFFSCKQHSNQNTVIQASDTLRHFLEVANNDSIALNKRKEFTDKALKMVLSQKPDSINRANYFKIANRYFNINDLENYKKISFDIVKQSIKQNDSLSLAKAYSYLGDYYNAKFIADSSYFFYYSAEKIYLKLNKNELIAKNLLNKCILQFNERDYIGSQKSAFDALYFLKKERNTNLEYEAYNILGFIHNELSDFIKALEYHNKALSIASLSGFEDDSKIFYSLHNIGLVYQTNNDDEQAIIFFTKAMESNKIYLNTINYAVLIDNLGYSKLRLLQFENLPHLFITSLKISDSLNSVTNKLSSQVHLSQYYQIKKDTSRAKYFASQAYNIALINRIDKYRLLTLKELIIIDYANAKKYSQEYIRISDSLQLAERKNINKFARIEYETEELTLEKDKLIEQRKTLIYIALGILLIGVFIFVIRFQAAKNRELTLVQEQQKANEEIYQLMINQQNKVEEVRQAEKKRIAQELHDGILGKLFGTRMNLGVLNNRDDSNAKTERVAYIDELKTLEQEIREISHDLNSEKTAVFNNFVLMVTNFFETQKTVCKAAISFSIDPKIEWNIVDNMAKINFYRILQEAFQNINKYSEAKNVVVSFDQNGSRVQLNIKDDGIGFVPTRKKKGIGLQNMNSRILSSGGTMEIITKPSEGTLLKFEIPIG